MNGRLLVHDSTNSLSSLVLSILQNSRCCCATRVAPLSAREGSVPNAVLNRPAESGGVERKKNQRGAPARQNQVWRALLQPNASGNGRRRPQRRLPVNQPKRSDPWKTTSGIWWIDSGCRSFAAICLSCSGSRNVDIFPGADRYRIVLACRHVYRGGVVCYWQSQCFRECANPPETRPMES